MVRGRQLGGRADNLTEEGSESTLVNGDDKSERLASELGPGCQSLDGARNVNIESLYEVSLCSVNAG